MSIDFNIHYTLFYDINTDRYLYCITMFMYKDVYIPKHQPAIGLFKYMYKDLYETIIKRALYKWKNLRRYFMHDCSIFLRCIFVGNCAIGKRKFIKYNFLYNSFLLSIFYSSNDN